MSTPDSKFGVTRDACRCRRCTAARASICCCGWRRRSGCCMPKDKRKWQPCGVGLVDWDHQKAISVYSAPGGCVYPRGRGNPCGCGTDRCPPPGSPPLSTHPCVGRGFFRVRGGAQSGNAGKVRAWTCESCELVSDHSLGLRSLWSCLIILSVLVATDCPQVAPPCLRRTP